MTRPICIVTAILLALATRSVAETAQKATLQSEGKTRTYYLVVPKSVKAEHPAPLLIVLHGSGRNGLSLVDKWKDLAVKEGIILAGPDAINSQGWNVPNDGPVFLRDLVTELTSKYPIDSRRLYLFGHSAGASFALYMTLFESEYFAATAIHAGALPPESFWTVETATRKAPIYIAVGTVDRSFPLDLVRQTRDVLNKNGFNVQLVEMKGHDHWYYDLAPKINAEAWNFLKQYKLDQDPRYTPHTFK